MRGTRFINKTLIDELPPENHVNKYAQIRRRSGVRSVGMARMWHVAIFGILYFVLSYTHEIISFNFTIYVYISTDMSREPSGVAQSV